MSEELKRGTKVTWIHAPFDGPRTQMTVLEVNGIMTRTGWFDVNRSWQSVSFPTDELVTDE